jgi:hypothetical protein
MKPTVTRGATHNFQAPENWDASTDGPCGDLQVRADCFGERDIVELVSTWRPSADELVRLLHGGVVEIGLCVTTQPPMRAYVVDPVEPALVPYVHAQDEKAAITINEEAHGHE